MLNKIKKIIIELLPILVMICLIPLVQNDYLLASIYIAIIAVALYIQKEKNDFLFLAIGFVSMILSESLFVSTGVETFVRNSLFGIMPLWLPFLWSYAFVVMKRGLKIIEN